MSNYIYHYVYRITNKNLKKHYYGVRSCNDHPLNDLGIKYFSSSKDKNFMIDQKENPKNYRYKIVRIFDNRIEAANLEIYLHEKFDVARNQNFYNKAKHTSTGFDITGTTHSVSEETRRKISESHKGKPYNGIIWNKGKYGYTIHSKEYKYRLRKELSIPLSERFGAEKAKEIIEKVRRKLIGKTHKEIYGDRSNKIKEKIRIKMKGKTLEEILGSSDKAEIGKLYRRENYTLHEYQFKKGQIAHNKITMSPEILHEMNDKNSSGMTWNEICQEYDISLPTLLLKFKEHGITKRKLSRWYKPQTT